MTDTPQQPATEPTCRHCGEAAETPEVRCPACGYFVDTVGRYMRCEDPGCGWHIDTRVSETPKPTVTCRVCEGSGRVAPPPTPGKADGEPAWDSATRRKTEANRERLHAEQPAPAVGDWKRITSDPTTWPPENVKVLWIDDRDYVRADWRRGDRLSGEGWHVGDWRYWAHFSLPGEEQPVLPTPCKHCGEPHDHPYHIDPKQWRHTYNEEEQAEHPAQASATERRPDHIGDTNEMTLPPASPAPAGSPLAGELRRRIQECPKSWKAFVGTISLPIDKLVAIADALEERDRFAERCRVMEGALNFYADEDMYDSFVYGDNEESGPTVLTDRGEQARAALADAREAGGE